MVINWINDVYTQERSILTCSNFDANATAVAISVISPVDTGISAKYLIPVSGILQADLSDLVRIINIGQAAINEMDTNGGIISTETISWSVAGRINPTSVIIPQIITTNNRPDIDSYVKICAPGVLLKSINAAAPIQFELFGTYGYENITMRIWYPPVSSTFTEYSRELVIPYDAAEVDIWHLSDFIQYRSVIKDLECEKKYAMVEWVSYTGKTRRHTFEIVKNTIEYTDSIDIETITNQYDQRKNRRDGFTLRLEGLSCYDLWYYSDLITSSQVKVSLDGMNWHQVEVTAKKQTIPESDAGKFNVLEIPINYRKYDTL